MTARRTPRAVARLLALASLTLPLAATVALGTAPAALAAVSISWSAPTPAADGVVTGGSSIGVTASYSSGTRPQLILLLTPPGGGSPHNFTKAACTVTLTSSCPSGSMSVSYPLTDSNGVPVPNGSWSAQVCTTLQCSSVLASRTFYTNVAPSGVPGNVTATATNPAPGATTGTIAVSWTYGGPETDIWGYRVSDGNGWSADLSGSDVGCASGGTCSTSKQYDNAPGSTTSYSFTVTALRTSGGCSSCGSTVPGSASSPATAQLVTPQPPPSPTPTPSASASPAPGGGTSSGTTGGTSGGSTGSTGGTQASGKGGSSGPAIIVPTLSPLAAKRKAFALGFNNFSPSLGIPKLPPLPATTFPETVGGTDGGYQPTLPYKPQSTSTTTTLLSGTPFAAVTSLDTQQLAKMLAAALILIAAAAHLRFFLRSHQPE